MNKEQLISESAKNKEIFDALRKAEAECNEKHKNCAQSLADLTAKADEEMKPEDMKHMVKYMGEYINYVNQRVSRAFEAVYNCEDMLAKHCNTNHVPPLPAAAMEKFLKTVGLDDNYEVVRPKIYSTASNAKNYKILVDFSEKTF